MDLLHFFLAALGIVVGVGVLLIVASIAFFLLIAIWKSYFEMLHKPTQPAQKKDVPLA